MSDGKIIAISISEQKGQKKHNIEQANLIVDHGMEGDAHAGNWHRQISLLGIASIEHMKAQGADVKPGDFAELELLVTDVSGWNDPGSFIDQVEVEPLSAKAHANILMGDTNYPMHSMSLLIKNLSEKDISGINVGGIVYGAEEKPIDFFMKSYGSFTGEEIVIPAGESRIISAQSFTQSGRCVGYGSLTDPFKIEYYLGFNFNTEENVFPYGTITGEIVVE